MGTHHYLDADPTKAGGGETRSRSPQSTFAIVGPKSKFLFPIEKSYATATLGCHPRIPVNL